MLGQQVRRYRMAVGMNAKALAEQAGLSRGYLSELENGHATDPSARILTRIADVLGVPVQDLLGTQPPPLRCKHWGVQWTTHPGGTVECMSCGTTWETQAR